MDNIQDESKNSIINAIPVQGRAYIDDDAYKACDIVDRLKIIEMAILMNQDDPIFCMYTECKYQYKLLNYIDFYVMSILGRNYKMCIKKSDITVMAECIACALIKPDIVYRGAIK